jgi:hypothetical protein
METTIKWRTMFRKKNNIIIVIQNHEVCWLSGDHSNGGGHDFRLPLDQVLDAENTPVQLPEWLKSKHSPLCIIPDHWFGSQSYPFRSKKASLIEPFLERKLIAAHPGHDDIRHFFNYRHIGDGKNQELSALFFQEDKSYQLYSALRHLNHVPRQITAPAFLWEEYLGHYDDDFNRQGTLLVHHVEQEGHLYFYYNGIYQFSRIVGLPDSNEAVEALGFEINQSLYMFSQKAKSDLDRIYMLCDAPQCREKLGDTVGREMIDLKSLTQGGADAAIIPEIGTLDGLLQSLPTSGHASFFGVMHRKVQQAMKWKPVQWAGICIGLLLLIGISCEQFLLGQMLKEARSNYQGLRQQMLDSGSTLGLSEYSSTLEQVLSMAKQSNQAYIAHGLPAAFPAGTELRELEYRFDYPPTVKVTAMVLSRDADELQVKLSRLIVQIKEKLITARDITLKDIDIRLHQPDDGKGLNNYEIAFQLELT